MIKLYREEISPQADAIEAEFRELVPGYDRLTIGKDEATRLMRVWQLFQGDHCYVDDDGETC